MFFPIFMTTIIREKNNGAYQSKLSLKNAFKEIESTQEKLLQSCVLCPITKVTNSSNRVKNASKIVFLYFYYYYLSSYRLVILFRFDLFFNISYFS